MLIFLICFKLALTDDNTDKYNSTPDQSVIQTIAMNAVLGNETDITEEQLNSMLAYSIEHTNEKGLYNKNCKLLAAYIDINANKPCRFYFQLELKERKFGFSSDVDISINNSNNQINLAFSNAKVGRLKIPKSLITTVLEMTELEIFSKYILIDELSVSLPTNMDLEIPGLGQTVTIDIEELQINDDKIHIKTNPILGDTLDNIKDILGDKILDFAKDKLPDSIGDYIDKFK